MERLRDGQPGLHESWRELAEHSLTHDDLPVRPGDDDVPVIVPAPADPAAVGLDPARWTYIGPGPDGTGSMFTAPAGSLPTTRSPS